ncbi:MAG TPA: M48 family metalloprotease, partial [Bdellovibrio sp.]|nr:M48 family metalloprotease [Bdellovibrio sp.]
SLYMQMIPHAFMDTTGFNSTPEAFTVPGMSADEPLFPLFPMFEKRLMGQKFIGAYIPNTYLGTYKPAPGTIMFGSAPHTPQVIAAESQILKMHMTPFMLNGDLLALDPSIDSVRVLNSSTFGFSFDLASLGHNSLNLGKSEGTNLGEPFNQTFKSIQRILEGPQAEKAFQNTLKLLPYYQAYLAYNGSRADNNSPNNLEAVPAKAMKPPQPQQVSLPAPMSLEQFSSELQNLHRELLSHLQKEIDWQKKVMDTVGMTMILKDLEASQFIQELCDQVAATLQVPPNLSPRCRIQATLAPNAFAFPGGDIFVTVGLIGILSDLDSLMFVLGHEVGHVVARHSTKSWGVVAPLEGVFNVAALASNLWSLSGGLGMWGVNLTSWFPKSLAAGQIAGHTLSWSMQGVGIGLAAYSRD